MRFGKKIFFFIIFIIIHAYSVQAFKIWRICIKGNDIQLFWDKANDTCNGFVEYEVFGRMNQLSAFNSISKISSINQNTFIHIGAKNISINWNYFVKVRFLCGSNVVEIVSDTLNIDQDIPLNVEIDTVSVLNGKLVIGWEKGLSSDTKGYIIYYVDASNNNIILDTVYGRESTFYTDTIKGNSAQNIIQYRIASIDSCDNISKISKEQNNLKLALNQDTCKNYISLSWNYYTYWSQNEYKFVIYYKESTETNYHKLIILGGGICAYSFLNPKDKVLYEFYVRAENNLTHFTSSSDYRRIFTDFVENPAYLYIKSVSVDDKDISINWVIDKTADLLGFKIC